MLQNDFTSGFEYNNFSTERSDRNFFIPGTNVDIILQESFNVNSSEICDRKFFSIVCTRSFPKKASFLLTPPTDLTPSTPYWIIKIISGVMF